jgi:hypothetical protein
LHRLSQGDRILRSTCSDHSKFGGRDVTFQCDAPFVDFLWFMYEETM